MGGGQFRRRSWGAGFGVGVSAAPLGQGERKRCSFFHAAAGFGGWVALGRCDPGGRSARGGRLKPGWGSPLKRAGDRKETEYGDGLVYHR